MPSWSSSWIHFGVSSHTGRTSLILPPQRHQYHHWCPSTEVRVSNPFQNLPFSFKPTLLSFNLHKTKCYHFNYTVLWNLTYMNIIIPIKIQIISITPKSTFMPLCNQYLSPHKLSENKWSVFYFLVLLLLGFHKTEIMQYVHFVFGFICSA